MVTGGGLSCDAAGAIEAKPRWVSCRPGFFLPVRVLSRLFRGKFLAGLQAVPADAIEAAKMDGAGPARVYWAIIVPQLRSAFAVAILINIINVFNSLPILKVMTGSIPGYGADTIMTMIFKYIELHKKVDVASALSVVAFLIVIAIVAIYVKAVKPMKEV